MRFILRFVLALQLSCVAFLGGCGDNAAVILPCSEVDRSDTAQLTGVPTFSALQIAPGESLTISVPVDSKTRSVRAIVDSVDLPGVGSGGLAETNGGEIVEIPVATTDLPVGAYIASKITLMGDGIQQLGVYLAGEESPYVLSSPTGGDTYNRCLTEIDAPMVVIVNDASVQP